MWIGSIAITWQNCKSYVLPFSVSNEYWSRLHHEVDAFVRYISPTPVEDEVRSLVVQLISRAVSEAFPDARVLPGHK